MKARYTSLQADVGSSEEHWTELADVTSIDGMPVVAAALHSQVPAVAAAFKQARPDARLAYVMTDGAALPLALSDLVAQLRDRELLDATITCGHAFGGDYEAVSVYSALAVARHIAHADAAIVAMGPGIVGTATPARVQRHRGRARARRRASGLGGVPIACLRVSFADPRPRHRGVSHHSATALTIATRGRVLDPGAARRRRRGAACCAPTSRRRASTDRHELVDVAPAGIVELLRAPRSARRVDGPARGRRSRSCSKRPPPRAIVAAQRRSRSLPPVTDAPVAGRTRPQPARAAARHPRAAHPRGVRARGRRLSAADRREPPRVRARQGDPARAWACRSRSRRSATAPRSATASAPTTTTCPISASTADETAALRVAVSAVSLGDGSGAGRADEARRRRRPARRRRSRRCRSRPRSRRCSRRSATARSCTFTYRGETAHARAVGPLVEARPLVRRRLRPRSATPCARSAPTASTATSRSASRRVRRSPPTSAPTITSRTAAWLLGDAPPVTVRLAVDADHLDGVLAALGADARRRAGATDGGDASSRSRSPTAPRSAASCSASSSTPRSSNRPRCAPTSSRGSRPSRPAPREPASRSPAPRSSASSRSCRGSSRTPARRRTRSRRGSA